MSHCSGIWNPITFHCTLFHVDLLTDIIKGKNYFSGTSKRKGRLQRSAQDPVSLLQSHRETQSPKMLFLDCASFA